MQEQSTRGQHGHTTVLPGEIYKQWNVLERVGNGFSKVLLRHTEERPREPGGVFLVGEPVSGVNRAEDNILEDNHLRTTVEISILILFCAILGRIQKCLFFLYF